MSVSERRDPPSPADADLSNWRVRPFSHWAFQHVRELIPVAEIAASPDGAWALDSAPRTLAGFNLPQRDGSGLDLEAFASATATDGLVVLFEGRVVYEIYGHGATATSPHILMSATKAVIGLLAGILQARAGLDLNAVVSDYVPEIAHSPFRGATLRHLADMRTGVALDDAQQAAYDAATNWQPRAAGAKPADLHGFFTDLIGPAPQHGGPFRYLSANVDLLGWAIERATGETIADLLSARLWRPLGAEADAYITLDQTGAARCTSGLCATTRDLARLGQLVVQGGRRGDAQIVPEAWIEDLAQGGDRDAWRTGEWGPGFASISPDMSYRSGWYAIDGDPQTLFAMGVCGQDLFVDRANRIVVAKTSSQANPSDYRMLSLTHQAVSEIRRRLLQGDI